MKKKIIFFVMTLIVLLDVGHVFAKNDITIENRTLENGQVEVLLKIDESLDIYGGSVVYQYDDKKLRLQETQVNKDKDYLFVINDHYQNNQIKAVFASAKVLKGNLVLLIFESLDHGSIDQDDITIEDIIINDSSGKKQSIMNTDYVQLNYTTGTSMAKDDTMNAYEESENEETVSDSSVTVEQQNDTNENNVKKTKEEKKPQQDYTSLLYTIIVIAGVVIIVIGLVLYRNKHKKTIS